MRLKNLINKRYLNEDNNDEWKRKVIDGAEYIEYLDEIRKFFGSPPKVGDPEWGGATQSELESWREKAEQYAEEWSVSDNHGQELSETDESELAFWIESNIENRIESTLYGIAEDLGFGTDIDKAIKAMRSVNDNI